MPVVPRASPKSAEHSEFRVITTHAEPLIDSTHFLHQYMSPFTMLPSVLFYKEGLYICMQHSSKHWCGSPFTSSPHHHLVRVGVNTSSYFNSHSFHSTLISTSLFNSICHMAIWAQIANSKLQIAIPPWSLHLPHLIGPRSSRTTTASTLYQLELVPTTLKSRTLLAQTVSRSNRIEEFRRSSRTFLPPVLDTRSGSKPEPKS
jgi:hypothetical protein